MSWVEAAIRWYAVLAALTWAFAPGVRWLCTRLPDRGVSLTRPLAMLAAVYPAWLLASLGLTGFGGAVVWVSVALAASLGWGVSLRRGGEVVPWLQSLAIAEIASIGLFAAYVWLRGFTPQILGTEKPMDVAFLASSMRAVAMPPPDPWFAGEPINYYYLGYLLHGTVGRLAGVVPEIAFNLALATVFSASVVAAFGVVWNVVAPSWGRGLTVVSATFGAFAVAIAGNLYAPWRLLQDAQTTVAAWWWAGEGIGWRSSRIVCDGARVGGECRFPATETINEFPFFSFLLGDLHPHLMALPYSLVAVGLAWNLWRMRADARPARSMAWWGRVALSGAAVGALYPLNAWDVPTYLALLGIAAWVAAGESIRTAVRSWVLVTVSAVLAWLPFLLAYEPPSTDAAGSGIAALPGVATVASAVALHLGERTSLGEYLTIFAVPYAAGLALLVAIWRRSPAPDAEIRPSTLAVVAAATIVPGVILSAPVVPLCGIPLALALILFRRVPRSAPDVFALVLFATAWTLSIGVELIYVRDAFDDRMNTLFKFYYQAWTLYALAAAIALAALWQAARIAWQRTLVAVAASTAVVAGLAYPVVSTYQWTEEFAAWRGLDGLAYGQETAPDEVAAIRWLGNRAQPGDVVLEAAGCSYYPFGRLPFNRVSAFTGIPTVIGWSNHERQWRAGQPDRLADIPARQSDVARIYADPSGPEADRYGVEWLFVGEYETGNWRAECESAGPYDGVAASDYPGSGWAEAFRSGDVRVFRRAAP